MTTTFVHIPADRFLTKLDEIGQKITAKGGRYVKEEKRGSEIVYEIALPPSEARSEFVVLKIYTSITSGAHEVRDSGEDAIRIATGSISTGEFKRIKDTITVKRTAPNGIGDRVGAFLERFTLTLRDAYRFAQTIPLCECGHHMARRESRGGGGEVKAFWGCTTYPACKKTKNI
jgi:hypothetical protein